MLPGNCGINKTFSNNILSKKYAEGLKLNGLKFVWSLVASCYPEEWSRNNIDTFWCAITFKAHCIPVPVRNSTVHTTPHKMYGTRLNIK